MSVARWAGGRWPWRRGGRRRGRGRRRPTSAGWQKKNSQRRGQTQGCGGPAVAGRLLACMTRKGAQHAHAHIPRQMETHTPHVMTRMHGTKRRSTRAHTHGQMETRASGQTALGRRGEGGGDVEATGASRMAASTTVRKELKRVSCAAVKKWSNGGQRVVKRGSKGGQVAASRRGRKRRYRVRKGGCTAMSAWKRSNCGQTVRFASARGAAATNRRLRPGPAPRPRRR